MRTSRLAARPPTCHVNIGATPRVSFMRFSHLRLRSSRSSGSPSPSKDHTTGSISDSIIDFFDDITRGSVSMDEDDTMPPTADTAVQSKAAAAVIAPTAAIASNNIDVSVGEYEVAAAAAVVVALSSLDTTVDSSNSNSSTKAPGDQDSSSSSSSTGAPGVQDSSSNLTPTRAPGPDVRASQPSIHLTDGSDDTGSSSSSRSNGTTSRQAVVQEATAASSGQLQKSSVSLAAGAEAAGGLTSGQMMQWLMQGAAGVGALVALWACTAKAMQQVGASCGIPPAVISMMVVPLLLLVAGTHAADKAVNVFDRAVAPWTTDLLGLFFVPPIAVLPTLLRGMQGADLAGLLTVTALSTLATLAVTAAAALALRPTVQQPHSSIPAEQQRHSLSGCCSLISGPAAPVLLSLSFLAAAGPLALTKFDPVTFGAEMALPAGFAWSLLGYVAARVYLQQGAEKGGKRLLLSPVFAGVLAASVGVAWHGRLLGWDYLTALSRYYTGEVVGAGDILTLPLGAALTGIGVLIYKHRKAVCLTAAVATGLLSMGLSVATSVLVSRLLGVSADWARALMPRSVTSSTASHIADALGAPAACTGLVVLLQAAITVVVGSSIMQAMRGKLWSEADVATAAGTCLGSTAGVLGAAAVGGRNELVLAQGAVSYAVMVVLGSILSNAPVLSRALAAMVA